MKIWFQVYTGNVNALTDANAKDILSAIQPFYETGKLGGILATGMMLSGAAINYLAVTVIWPFSYVDLPFTLFGLIPSHIKTQVLVASLGFGLFGGSSFQLILRMDS